MPTKIEWTDEAWNPVTGCTKVSAGCTNCYAEAMSKRLQAMGLQKYRNGFRVTTHPDALEQPLRWRKPRRVFVCSMGDLFHEDVPDDFINQVIDVMGYEKKTARHTFLVLTKRVDRMVNLLKGIGPRPKPEWISWRAPDETPNIIWGVSVEDQNTADERIPILLQAPAARRFVSVEPQLAPVDLTCITPIRVDRGLYGQNVLDQKYQSIDWVICGCESGPNRRPFDNDWARSLRDQCQSANVPFFFKQGRDEKNRVVHMPELDGRVWDQMPE